MDERYKYSKRNDQWDEDSEAVGKVLQLIKQTTSVNARGLWSRAIGKG